ncbi:MAG: hypothetical protein WBS22_09785, partial [Methylocystis sp.]
ETHEAIETKLDEAFALTLRLEREEALLALDIMKMLVGWQIDRLEPERRNRLIEKARQPAQSYSV